MCLWLIWMSAMYIDNLFCSAAYWHGLQLNWLPFMCRVTSVHVSAIAANEVWEEIQRVWKVTVFQHALTILVCSRIAVAQGVNLEKSISSTWNSTMQVEEIIASESAALAAGSLAALLGPQHPSIVSECVKCLQLQLQSARFACICFEAGFCLGIMTRCDGSVCDILPRMCQQEAVISTCSMCCIGGCDYWSAPNRMAILGFSCRPAQGTPRQFSSQLFFAQACVLALLMVAFIC